MTFRSPIKHCRNCGNAVVYRLKRRIEKATPAVVPLQAKSRVGYQFRAPLRAR